MHRRLVALLVLASVARPAAADESLGGGAERHLDGHGFLPSIYVETPFVSSSFHNYTGGAMGVGLETPFRDVDGNELFVLKGDLIFASLGLGYRQQVGDRAGVGITLSGLARTGTNAESFITEGADAIRQVDVRAKYRVLRSDQDQVSAGLNWSYSKTLYFTPREFARHIADGGSLEDAPIVVNDEYWTARVAASWAHAFSALYGVRISGDFGVYDEPGTSGILLGSHRVGILGEADLQHTGLGFPLGITAGYTQNLPDTDLRTGPGGWLAGLWYTGREDFIVGGEWGYMKLPIGEAETDKVRTIFGVFTIQYYF